jgi:hypothetical protein
MNNKYDVFQELGGFKGIFGVGLEKISGWALAELTAQVAEFLTNGPMVRKTCVLFELHMEKARENSVGVYPHRSLNYW